MVKGIGFKYPLLRSSIPLSPEINPCYGPDDILDTVCLEVFEGRGKGDTQIWFGQVCAAQALKPIPTFKERYIYTFSFLLIVMFKRLKQASSGQLQH